MSHALDRDRRLRAVFDAAVLQEPSARAAYVDQACTTDPDLRPEVMRLLEAHDEAQSFLTHLPDLAPSQVWAAEHFSGTSRFRVVRRLGAGGMGVVYAVHDRVRDEVVALKTLLRTRAADLYRLKQEFRSLADVAHVNLACLYELFVEEEQCFFTMELVEGVSFVDHARGIDRAHRSDERLVSALRQLIEGVAALHRRGKLHRDVKPSNVLVTPAGRVVILDFGLITELIPQHIGGVRSSSAGTPAYMSPEEISGRTPSEASDWYAVGVTLYEALTGTLPFQGPLLDVLRWKTTFDPPSPVEKAHDVPADLSAICMGLICRDPVRRLSGLEALRRLACDTASSAPDIASTTAATPDASFVGRDRQLRRLSEALDEVAAGHAKVVSIYGPSGIGKSALARRFLGHVGSRADVVALYGRCYENESVPYKALDGVIDDLSRLLLSMPTGDIEELMPPSVLPLTRVFPVMLQVEAIAKAISDRESPNADPIDLRRRAFEALREILRRLAARQPLVIWIDDLQWADADSVVLIEELLRPPSPPAMLLLLCFRSEETAAKPFLQLLVERADRDMWSTIPLEPMTENEARTLIGELLPANSTLTEHDQRCMTSEARGSPFVLEQLARHVGVHNLESGRAPTFAEMFAMRLGGLSAEGRCFLETLALCGRPMAPELVCDAAGLERDRQSLVATLRSSRFIRSSGSSERIEVYHDRIREVVAAQVPAAAARRIHGLVVSALVNRRSDDCEALFEHYRGAGDSDNASRQAALAAAKAATALAFDRAALFYQEALTLTPNSSAAGAWSEGLATALANAGRPAEAAEAYLRAAAGADRIRGAELQRRGAEQFLIGGHIDRGLDLIRTTLAGMGLRAPRSPRAALPWLLWRRARLRWRGLGFVPRAADEIDRATLLRVDTCWSATAGLALVDVISASEFSVRHLLMALDAGEPFRIARGMAIEAAARGASPTGRESSDELVQESKALAYSVGNPHAIALSILAEGMLATTSGRWKSASTSSKQALAILRDQGVGATWESNLAQNLVIWSLMYQGELGEVCRLVPTLLANARRSGNLYIATELCTRCNFVWLAADDPDEGEREVTESIERWSHEGFHRQHYSAMLARVQTALYRGNAEAAWRLLAEKKSALRRSLLTRVQVLRIESLYLRARSALAMSVNNRNSHRFIAVARTAARRIARERMAWSDPIALLLEAAIAYREGETAVSQRILQDAVDRFERADMNLYAAIARRRLGELKGDAIGQALQRQAEAWMTAQTIRNTAAMTRMFAPGFPDLPSSI